MASGPIAARLAILLAAAATPVAAQHAPTAPDSTRVQIQRTLRAFYFNLAHQDWEALAADILPAKVVAHRPAPETLAIGAMAAAAGTVCTAAAAPAIDDATIMLEGDWAEVSVPRCTEPRGADEFRLIRFDRRWRFVDIDLFRKPLHVVTER